jgi:hypothetical protein
MPRHTCATTLPSMNVRGALERCVMVSSAYRPRQQVHRRQRRVHRRVDGTGSLRSLDLPDGHHDDPAVAALVAGWPNRREMHGKNVFEQPSRRSAATTTRTTPAVRGWDRMPARVSQRAIPTRSCRAVCS